MLVGHSWSCCRSLIPRLEACLARPGHSRFRDRIVHVFLPKETGIAEIWCILIGVTGELCHFAGLSVDKLCRSFSFS